MPEKLLDTLKIGYVVLFKNRGGFIGNQIEKTQLKRGFNADEACYTHCAMSNGGQWIVEVSPPKVKIVDIREKFKNHYICIIRYKNEDYQKKGRYKVALWATSHCNRRYDFFGVLALKFKIFWQWKSRPFCSENILWAFKQEYPRVMAIKAEECMPADYAKSKQFEIVWEGWI